MHHFFEAITNTSGESLVGYFARVIDPGTLGTVTLSSDDNGTPIITVSGVANMGVTDDYGNLSFYVDPGTYHLDIYAADSTTFVYRVPNVAMNSSKGDKGDPGNQGDTGASDSTFLSLAELQAIDPTIYPSPRLAAPSGSDGGVANGLFNYQLGNFTGRTDVVKVNGIPLTTGALIRQSSGSLTYQRPESGALTRTAESKINDIGLTSGDWPGITGDGEADDTAGLAALIAKADCTILARTYVVSDEIQLPAGRTIRVEAGTKFLWRGIDPANFTVAVGLFRVEADGCAILCTGPQGATFTVEAMIDHPYVSIAVGYAVSGFTMSGAFGRRVTRSYFDAAPGSALYADVVTTTMKAAGDARAINTNRNITIVGGGCEMDERPTGELGQRQRAMDLLFYCENVEVRDSDAIGAYCMIQYWGGDSGTGPGQTGADPFAERKFVNLRVSNVTGQYLGAGIFGSFARDVQISNCKGLDVGDVCFDAEGCQNVTFSNCHGERCGNGIFSSFSYSEKLLFSNCTGITEKKEEPIFRNYNQAQVAFCRDITIQGGRYECTDPTGPGTIDSMFGPAETLTVSGVKLINIIIDFNRQNNNQIRVTGNNLSFPYANGPFTAIDVGGHAATAAAPAPAVALVEGNTVTGVAQAANTIGIRAQGGDFNSSPLCVVRGNTISMGTAGIALEHTATNPGQVSRFRVSGNELGGAITTHSGPVAGMFSASNNFDFTGTAVELTAI